MKKCKDCGTELNALTLSDVDDNYCGNCADKRIEILQSDIADTDTTLLLWSKHICAIDGCKNKSENFKTSIFSSGMYCRKHFEEINGEIIRKL
jgi:hypothetical protein